MAAESPAAVPSPEKEVARLRTATGAGALLWEMERWTWWSDKAAWLRVGGGTDHGSGRLASCGGATTGLVSVCGCCNVSVAASCHKGSHLIGRRRGTAARPCFSSRASEVLLASEGSHWLDALATNPRFPASAPQHYWPTGLQPRPTSVPAEMAIESPLSAEPAARSRFRGLGLRCQQLGRPVLLASDTIKAKEAFSDYHVRLFISRSETVRKARPSSCLFSMQSVGLHTLDTVRST